MASDVSGSANFGVGSRRSTHAEAGDTGFAPVSSASRQIALMVEAWRRGERPLAEEILDQHPELSDEDAVRVIFEEFCLREELGVDADPADIVRRFPQWGNELEVLIDCHRLMESNTTAIFPEVGEVFAGFRLLSELGRGASGRVFLAEQPSLADRPVVLKVTTRGHEEHLSLARLQHMNIIPLYSEQVLLERNLRVLCMPYLGGATLSRILELIGSEPAESRAGRHLLEAIDHTQSTLPIALPAQGPYRQSLARYSYVQSICWIGASLADGLQYAHDRGLIHMDIKPSNVLITGDGQPMLLDFHLTRAPISPQGPAPIRLGGTPEYMSPEQREAMLTIRKGGANPPVVDGRSDIYSLGVLLYEALGGNVSPQDGHERPALDRRNARVSVGLSDIIQKSMAPDPNDRYADASELAGDLRRHLNDLPLRGVRNRSLSERWRKLRRRRPDVQFRHVAMLVAVFSAFVGGAIAWGVYLQRMHDVRGALHSGQSLREQAKYAEAARELQRGLAVTRWLPGAASLSETLKDELDRTRRDAKATELHKLADIVRFRYGVDPPLSDDARSLVRRGREIWSARHELVRPIRGRSKPEVERTVRTDLLDFAVVWADLRVRLASPDERAEANREALRVLDEAVELLGPSPALDRDRRAYALALGQPVSASAADPPRRSAWEHFDFGKSCLRSGNLTLAANEFRRAIDRRPQDFWPHFYLGLCAYRLHQYDDAVHAFEVAIALAPDVAECYYNRALAHTALKQFELANEDYARALEHNHTLTEAALNRGILSYKEGRYNDAILDFERASATTSDPHLLAAIQYNLALVSLARGDRVTALNRLKSAMMYGHKDASALYARMNP